MILRCLGGLAALLLTACAARAPAPPAAASEASVKAHVDAATAAAGNDLGALLVLCKPAPANKPPQEVADRAIAGLIGQPAPPPGQAFDNLYYIGAKWVSAWALTTSDGIVLIDALNNDTEAAGLIVGGLNKLGLDPAQIREVIVTHGHGDHYGGANFLVQRVHPRIAMSDIDWTMTETQLEFATPLWGAPPRRDVSLKDGDRVTVGNGTVQVVLTPGHTKGTISLLFDVTSKGARHRVLLWGGTAFNFGRDLGRLDSYIASTEKLKRLVAEQKVDVLLSNHSGYDEAIEKIERQRRQGSLEPNPFVIGTPAVQRALTVMGECARAQRDRFVISG